MAKSSNRFKVALIGYDGAQALDLVGPIEVFTMANNFGGEILYDVRLASPRGGQITTNSGLKIAGSIAINRLPRNLDTILVSGGTEAGLRSLSGSTTMNWLRSRSNDTRRIGSVCSGALVLAASGLLDGRRATTHWGTCDYMRTFRPQVILEPDAIFVSDPPYYTSAGITAGIDLCLSFVEADFGPKLALAVARNLVLFMRRPGGQSQYSAALNIQLTSTPRLRTLVSEITADPTGDLSLPVLASRAGMSERTFSRSFQKEAGVTPMAFVEIARVNRAKAILEISDWPLGRIAERAGFANLDAIHRAFQKRIGITPGEYRQRFGSR